MDLTASNRETSTAAAGPIASRLRLAALVLFGALVLRFAALWTNDAIGTTLPVLGHIGLTLLFTGFSLLHAATLIGMRRALAFLAICAAVTWSFEEVGVATGWVYGAYHYGDQLGPKVGAVPAVIPLAWFMMIYASWVISIVLLDGARRPDSLAATVSRILVAALVMTAWDTAMDPGMARSGVWIWENGGAYFGVPLRNFGGWLATTMTVYGGAEATMRFRGGAGRVAVADPYTSLPILVYGLVALDRVLLPDLPELRIGAAFGMGFMALLAGLRVLGRARG